MTGETFQAAYSRLSAALEATGREARRKPLGADLVPLRSIRTAPALFAARSGGGGADRGVRPHHVEDLKRAFKAKPDGTPLNALTVFEVAGDDYCVDGHHRLFGYRAAKWTGPVPVVRIGGTLADAVAESARANTMRFLPMTFRQRADLAWKLVVVGSGTKKEQAEWTGTGTTFIASLRQMRRRLEESHQGAEWGALWQAKQLDEGKEKEGDWSMDDEEAEIEEYRQRLLKGFGSKLHRRLPAVMRALAEIAGPARFTEVARPLLDQDEWDLMDDEAAEMADF